MIPNDTSNLKCIDNFIFVFATWICALREKKAGDGGWQKVDISTIIATIASATSQPSSQTNNNSSNFHPSILPQIQWKRSP